MSSSVILIFSLLVVIVILSSVASRFKLPYPILLVIGGLLLSFVPGLPKVGLNPELVLLFFLPPLIYASAWQISWREFRTNLRPILLLAVGLVLVTTVGVAAAAYLFIGLPWPVAFVLGAIVSPTDAIAASATAQNLGLSRRIVTIMEGESMINDATGLVVYRFAVAAVVTGGFSPAEAGWQFVLSTLGALAVGLIIAWLLEHIHRRFDDPLIEITITLLTPFAAYLLAEEVLHLSGVVATVAAGLYLSYHSARFFSSETRLQAKAVWGIFAFLLNGMIFLLIGLQQRGVIEEISRRSLFSLLWAALIICTVVFAIRIAYIFAISYLPHWLNPNLRERERMPHWQGVLLIGWSGMRGAVSLAAALALPVEIQAGGAFPDRDLVIFLTFSVILSTLILQGLSLLPLIHWLNPPNDLTTHEQERRQARIRATHAALRKIDVLAAKHTDEQEFLGRLRTRYEERLQRITSRSVEQQDNVQNHQELRKEILLAERATIIRLRDQGKIDDEVLNEIERELDLDEQRALPV